MYLDETTLKTSMQATERELRTRNENLFDYLSREIHSVRWDIVTRPGPGTSLLALIGVVLGIWALVKSW